MANAMQGVSITVFGRYNDFITKIKTEPPDAVITKTVLIKDQLSNYEVSLNGVRNGKTEERYVVLSIDRPLSIDSISIESVIGIIDILGRAGMNSFSKQFFSVEPKLKRVSKVEDLLPLLSFNMVNGVLIEDVYVDYFKSTSQLQFSVTNLTSSNNGIVAFAIKKGGNSEKSLNFLKRNDKAICALFYIDTWK